MNEIPKFAAPRTVTTGPIAGSRKVYAPFKGNADIRVPFREIALSERARAESVFTIRRALHRKPTPSSTSPRGLARARLGSARNFDFAQPRPSSPRTTAKFPVDRLAPLCPASDACAGKAGPARHPARIRAPGSSRTR